MSRRLWVMFVTSQAIGAGLAFFSSRFQVGVGGTRDLLWIPAMLILLPGVLIGYAADAFDFGIRMGSWYGLPFFVVVVLVNAACWNAIIFFVRRRRHRSEGRSVN